MPKLIEQPLRLGSQLQESLAEDGTKKYYLTGKVQQTTVNQNGRAYTEAMWDALHDDPKFNEKLEKGLLVGAVGHPKDGIFDEMKIATKVVKHWREGQNVFAKREILPTPDGNYLLTLFKSGVNLGTSSRGRGDSKSNSEGVIEVLPGFILEGYDDVIEPSVKDAYTDLKTESINESLNTLTQNVLSRLKSTDCTEREISNYKSFYESIGHVEVYESIETKIATVEFLESKWNETLKLHPTKTNDEVASDLQAIFKNATDNIKKILAKKNQEEIDNAASVKSEDDLLTSYISDKNLTSIPESDVDTIMKDLGLKDMTHEQAIALIAKLGIELVTSKQQEEQDKKNMDKLQEALEGKSKAELKLAESLHTLESSQKLNTTLTENAKVLEKKVSDSLAVESKLKARIAHLEKWQAAAIEIGDKTLSSKVTLESELKDTTKKLEAAASIIGTMSEDLDKTKTKSIASHLESTIAKFRPAQREMVKEMLEGVQSIAEIDKKAKKMNEMFISQDPSCPNIFAESNTGKKTIVEGKVEGDKLYEGMDALSAAIAKKQRDAGVIK